MAKKSIKDATVDDVSVKETVVEVAGVEEVTEQVTEVVKADAELVIKQKIYVGPNILGLPTYTVIESEFTAHINGFIEKCPEIKKLFVPIAEMANTEKRIEQKGTLEHRHYQKVVAFKSAVREGDQ